MKLFIKGAIIALVVALVILIPGATAGEDQPSPEAVECWDTGIDCYDCEFDWECLFTMGTGRIWLADYYHCYDFTSGYEWYECRNWWENGCSFRCS